MDFHFWANTRTPAASAAAAGCLGDYPTLGVDEDALYIGVNQFCGADLNTVTFDSTSAYVVNRADLLAGTLTVAQFDGVLPSIGRRACTRRRAWTTSTRTPTRATSSASTTCSSAASQLRRVSNPGGTPSLSG